MGLFAKSSHCTGALAALVRSRASALQLAIPAIMLFCWGVHQALAVRYARLSHPAEREFPIRGVDVSHHQGAISWASVKRDGLSFAYIKATEGATLQDPRFAENVRGAHGAGLAVGAYHFFTFCRSGPDQADNVSATLDSTESRKLLTLPLAIDVETEGNCNVQPTSLALGAELEAFVVRLRDRLHPSALIYTTTAMLESYPRLKDSTLWLRNFSRVPEVGTWRFWQFGTGRVSGIGTPVDLDAFCGSSESWASWTTVR